jgi:hypothetical protein
VVTPGQKIDLNFRLKVVRAGVANDVTFADLLTRRTIVAVYMKNNTAGWNSGHGCSVISSTRSCSILSCARAGFSWR